jgi:phage terminase small subunit
MLGPKGPEDALGSMAGKQPSDNASELESGPESAADTELDALSQALEDEFMRSETQERLPALPPILDPTEDLEPRDDQALEKFPEINPFGLSAKELRFCHAIACGWTNTQAAEWAGYKGGASTASKQLQREDVQAEIKRLSAARAETNQLKAPEHSGGLIDRLWEIANVNVIDAYIQEENKDGTVTTRAKRFKDMPQPVQRSIKKIRVVKGEVIEIEFHNALEASAKLSAYYGLGRGFGPASPGGDIPSEDSGEEPIQVPQAQGGPIRTLTFEERMSANGSKLRRTILQQRG